MKKEEVVKILSPIKDLYKIKFEEKDLSMLIPTGIINIDYDAIDEIRDEWRFYVIIGKREDLEYRLVLSKIESIYTNLFIYSLKKEMKK
jgi:hypothetical protein